jgi:NADPH:quinone reductase
MRAFAIDAFGERGSVRDLPDPAPGEGQVLVRMAAASVNPVDAAVAAGYLKDMMEHRFPLVLGSDGAGTVEAVGAGAGFGVGDRVFGVPGKPYLGEGTDAELATLSVAGIARTPAALDHTQAAAVPVAGGTALSLARAVAARDGDVVLAVGATGGVGSYLVQLVARDGGRVVAVCRGANADYARALGAVDVIDYTEGDVAEAVRSRYPDGIDAIADMVGDRDSMPRLARLVRRGGRIASCVGAGELEGLAEAGVTGANVGAATDPESLTSLASALANGDLRHPEIRTLALQEAADALARAGARHTRGKVVLTIG